MRAQQFARPRGAHSALASRQIDDGNLAVVEPGTWSTSHLRRSLASCMDQMCVEDWSMPLAQCVAPSCWLELLVARHGTTCCVVLWRRGRRTTDLTKGAATLPYFGPSRAQLSSLSIFTNGRLVGAIPTCSHVRCVGLSGDGPALVPRGGRVFLIPGRRPSCRVHWRPSLALAVCHEALDHISQGQRRPHMLCAGFLL